MMSQGQEGQAARVLRLHDVITDDLEQRRAGPREGRTSGIARSALTKISGQYGFKIRLEPEQGSHRAYGS